MPNLGASVSSNFENSTSENFSPDKENENPDDILNISATIHSNRKSLRKKNKNQIDKSQNLKPNKSIALQQEDRKNLNKKALQPNKSLALQQEDRINSGKQGEIKNIPAPILSKSVEYNTTSHHLTESLKSIDLYTKPKKVSKPKVDSNLKRPKKQTTVKDYKLLELYESAPLDNSRKMVESSLEIAAKLVNVISE